MILSPKIEKIPTLHAENIPPYRVWFTLPNYHGLSLRQGLILDTGELGPYIVIGTRMDVFFKNNKIAIDFPY